MKRTSLCATLLILFAFSPLAKADWVSIDFESIPNPPAPQNNPNEDPIYTYDNDNFGDHTVTDNSTINGYYNQMYGVWFQSLNADGDPADADDQTPEIEPVYPYLEAAGGETSNAFRYEAYHYSGQSGGASGFDLEAPAFVDKLGNYLLKTKEDLDQGNLMALRINFERGAYQVEGEIWDIDAAPDAGLGAEGWEVIAYSNVDGELDSDGPIIGKDFKDPASLDGKPWKWSVQSNQAIDYVDLVWVSVDPSAEMEMRSTTEPIGVAFDNMSFTPTPEPATVALWGVLGMSGCGYFGLRRRKK